MGNEKSELERLIEQAREMVGDEGTLRLSCGPADRWSYANETTTGWRCELGAGRGGPRGSSGGAAMATPEGALRAGISDLVQRAGALSDEAQRLLHIARGDHD